MLILKKLNLTNFGKHKNFELTFAPGVTGIVGRNMSGKSTVLDSIKFALTGNLELPLQSYINRDANNTPAKVRLEFKTETSEGFIERIISNNGAAKIKLVSDCGFETNKTKEANLFFAENLGATREAVLDAVFIKQGELASEGLFGPPSKRLEFFQKLAGLSDLPKIADLSAKILDKLKLSQINIPSADELNNLQKQIADAKNEEQRILEKLQNLKYDKADDVWRLAFHILQTEKYLQNEIAAARQTIVVLRDTEKELKASSGWSPKKQEALKAEVERLQKLAGVQKLAEAKQNAISKLKEIRAKLNDQNLQQLAAEFDPDVFEKIAKAEKLFEQHQQAEQTCASVESTNQRLKSELEKLQFEAETTAVEITAFQNYLDDLESKETAQRAAKILAASAKNGICPLCGKPGFVFHEETSQTPDEISALKTNLKNLHAKKTALDRNIFKISSEVERNNSDLDKARQLLLSQEQVSKIKAVIQMKSWLAERQAAKETVSALSKEAEKFEAVLKSLGDDVPDCPDTEIFEKLKDAESKLKAAEEIGQKLRSEIPASLQAAEHLLKQKTSALDALLAEKEKIKQNLPKFAAEDPLKWLDEVQKEKQNLASIKAVIESVEKILSEREAVLQKFKTTADKIEKLEIIKLAFSKTGIPKILSDRLFENLCSAVNERLAVAGADFSVQKMPNEPVSFQFFEDGWWMPQEKLSGGGRVRLACAFLLALRNVILPDTSLLVLDEPSLHLDETGVEILRNMLSEISANVQIIVCDHNPLLFPSFAKTILLK